jgi:hypothetical protein
MKITIGAVAVIAALAAAGCGGSTPGPPPGAAAAPAASAAPSCSAQLSQWASGPGYGALKRLNNLVNDPIDISAAKLSQALAAVQADPLPVCARGHRWARMIREVKSAIVNARAGNQGTAAGAEGGAAADILVLGSNAQAAGYYGRFPG